MIAGQTKDRRPAIGLSRALKRFRSSFSFTPALLLATLTLGPYAYTSAADECDSLQQEISTGGAIAFKIIKTPGHYCLQQDMVQDPGRFFYDSNGRVRRSLMSFIIVTESGVSIDLKGKRVESSMQGQPLLVAIDPQVKPSTPTSGITLRNGVFSSPKAESAVRIPSNSFQGSRKEDLIDRARSSEFNEARLAHQRRLDEFDIQRGITPIQPTRTKHPRKITLENLLLESGDFGVLITGSGTRILRSRIIVKDSFAGIYVFGAGTVIEDNIIVFDGMGRNESAAPIKLHYADGAVIRNNLIIIRNAEFSPEQAISLFDSRNVTISGNRVFGARQLVRTFDDLTSLVDRDNLLAPATDAPRIGERTRDASEVFARMRTELPAAVSADPYPNRPN